MLSRASLLRLVPSLLMVFAACATPGPKLIGSGAEDVSGSIDAAWRAHSAAAIARDTEGIVDIYADDAVYVVDGQRPIVGKKALAAMESLGMQQGEIRAVRHRCEALRVDGDLAWELGSIDATVQPKEQAPQTVTFHFVAMWRLGKDRRWRIGHLVGQVEATLAR